jgi:hypothetical protein
LLLLPLLLAGILAAPGNQKATGCYKSKGRIMPKRLFVSVSLVLALAAITFAVDDPFTGTWRETAQMIILPNGDGYSFQLNGEKPSIHIYGKDSLANDGSTVKFVRVDSHHLTGTIGTNVRTLLNETATISPDGKRYTRTREFVGASFKEILEYDRVGPVPTGDAFFGTWKQTSPLKTLTIKVNGDMFNEAQRRNPPLRIENRTISEPNLTLKLGGKESKGADGVTHQAKRIDAQTIEVIQKTASDTNTFEQTTLYQVKGNTLIETTTSTLPNRKPSETITNFERIK